MNKKIIGLILSMIIFIGIWFIPVPEGLEVAGKNTLGLVLMVIVLLMTEAFPMGITSLLILIIACFLGLGTMKEVTLSFANPTIFFVLASFGISSAITKVPLAKRILVKILEMMGSSISKIILSFMFATMLISSIMSNVPSTALFMGIALSFLELFEDEEDKRRTGKALMIAIPFAGMIGGMMTPAGSSINILALGLLKEYTGTGISFIQWMTIGVPVALIMLPITWLFIIKIYKPATMKKDKIEHFVQTLKVSKKVEKKEIGVAMIILGMVAFWILSSWVPFLDATVIAVSGLCLMFLPKISILSWKEFSDEVSWDIILLIGCVMCMGNLILKNGVAQWFVALVFADLNQISLVGLIMILGFLVYGMQLALPIAPALVSALVSPLVIIATDLNFQPSILIIPLCAYAGCCMILPLDSVPLMTYATGYYRFFEMAKAGVPIIISLAIVMSLCVASIAPMVF